ncbi:DUF6880 family protein [Budvicia aquatica]|uniref:Uncharacterized protein n=1 Tax=Budvicia aquatica TaxID=82979 RepID=A0A2C6DJG6_9GAMM|nr:DUF6880 family protein [Budvicia aquatica]PHI28472.1 hypothetical protein CRN84_03585 [Budvicia aquatica]VFS46409.1 Uncharacterised protein [Budvicia aquatica]
MKKQNALINELALLDSVVLAVFIASIYGKDKMLDTKIERLLLKKDTSALIKSLKKNIKSLSKDNYFYRYYQTIELARDVRQLLVEIENHILPTSPDQAFQLADDLLDTAENSLERCDDSDGLVGDVYQDICLLWLKAASQSSVPATGWVPVVRSLVDNNDYGVLDPILPNAHLLLSPDELRQLAAYYENGLRASLKKKECEFSDTRWSVNLQGVAEALKDPEIYKLATLLVSPLPNVMQIERIVNFCIRCGAYDQAMKWLEDDWGSVGWKKPNAIRLSLLADCYLGLNQPEKRLDTLIKLMNVEPTYENFQMLVPLVSDDHIDKLRKQLIASVLNESELYDQLDPLLKLKEYAKAQALAIKGADEIAEWHYTQLLSLLDNTPEDGCIVRIILLRSLADDILDQGRSPAYHHAASYLQQLDKLDDKVASYASLPSHADYMAKIQVKHKRKSSFWPKYNSAQD